MFAFNPPERYRPFSFCFVTPRRALFSVAKRRHNVYTYWDSDATPEQAEMLRLWAASWSARGWNPRILTVRNAARHKAYAQFKHDPREHARLAGESVRAKWICPVGVINFSYRPGGYAGVSRTFGCPGWSTAALVKFSSPADVLSSNRPVSC